GAGVKPKRSSILPSWIVVHAHIGGPALSSASARLADRGTLGLDARHQVVPGLDERFGTLVLEPSGQRVYIDTRLDEVGQNRLAIASIRGECRPDFAMVAEG